MRRLLIISFPLFIFSCQNNKGGSGSNATRAATDSANFTTVQWIDTIKHIGRLKMGEKAQISFRFKNTGDKPLYIINAQPGCGCTVANYPKEAIAQGKEGVLVAAFDTNESHVGGFKKGITVTTNTKPDGITYLFFQGEIISKDVKNTEAKTVPVETPKKEDKKESS